MNYKEVKQKEQIEQCWKKEEYNSKKVELDSLALKYIKSELEYKHGSIKAFKAKLINVEEYEQEYINSKEKDKIVRTIFDVSYAFREYTGSRFGAQEVHKRIIEPAVKKKIDNGAYEILEREREEGFLFVNSILPEAVHRIGCYCCYGDGPDLECEIRETKNGGLILTYTVNFEFDMDEHY